MSLPLSKTLDPADLIELAEELVIVDQYFTSEREQHRMRRWEYALALRAYTTWKGDARGFGYSVDVGGAGSPFSQMLRAHAPEIAIVDVVDPAQGIQGYDLQSFLYHVGRLAPSVFCLSVLEHVEDLEEFVYHLSCLVAPGGLLFLTMDYWNQTGIDTAHFHWMRKRIFNEGSVKQLWHAFIHDFTYLGNQPWGVFDPIWHGPIEEGWGYTFASLALVKRQ